MVPIVLSWMTIATPPDYDPWYLQNHEVSSDCLLLAQSVLVAPRVLHWLTHFVNAWHLVLTMVAPRVAYTSPALVSTLDILCNLWLAQHWHTYCNASFVPEFDTGGPCWLVFINVVPPWTQNRWKLGILPCVLTTVSHWLALWLLLVVQ